MRLSLNAWVKNDVEVSRCSHAVLLPLPVTSSRMQVFLDEERLFASSVPYPRHISEPVAHCSIGWDLDGQMSGVLLLSGVAELKVLKSMLSRLAGGIDDIKQDAAACASTPPDLDLWDDTATVSAQQRLKRRLLGSKYRVFAALLPDRTINGLCLEPHNGQHALLRGDTTHVWITRHSQDVVKSIGGTLTVLSLAHELLSDTPQGPPATPIPSPATGQNVDTVLSVLLSFLDGNIANQVRNPVLPFVKGESTCVLALAE